MNYTINEIARVINGRICNEKDIIVRYLSIDSRTVLVPELSVFMAIRGRRNDGHDYVAALYDKGVRAFVTEDYREEFAALDDACFIVVDNVTDALQSLAAYHRRRFGYPVIGITGSNGKTIVKEWLSQLMAGDRKVVKSPKSYNSQVGVPLSVWRMGKDDDIAIIEAGISQRGEMKKLAEIIRPNIGIITNIGAAHSEGFRDNTEKLNEKLSLFEGTDKLIYCCEHSIIREAVSGRFAPDSLLCWGYSDDADIVVSNKSASEGITSFDVCYKDCTFSFELPFEDEASFENCMHCVSALLWLGYDMKHIAEGVANVHPVAMRMEIKEGINGSVVINDYYNSDPASLGIAVDLMIRQSGGRKKTLIISDLLETGYRSEDLYKEVASLVRIKGIDKIRGIGEEISKYSYLFDIDKSFYPDTASFIKMISRDDFANEAVLLRGAREFHFEEISNILQRKAHRTTLEVDLDAVTANLNYYRSLLKPATKMMVMVKAFSYGSGLTDISRILQYNRVDYLGVAIADEGITLRNSGINLPVIVMNPEEYSFDSMIEYKLEPEIYDFKQLDSFIRAVKRNGEDRYPVHIKIDTGMRRLGFVKKDIPKLKEVIKDNEYIFVRSVFSHLAASDEEMHDEFTRSQLNTFEYCSAEISSWFKHKVIRHILNSAGVERFADYQFEMVRLGIGLYGVSSHKQGLLHNVSTLKTTISQIKCIDAEDSVGYGRKGHIFAKDKGRIATIPIGYADGFDRRLGNGRGRVYINGKYAPVVGNICMDMSMIDITGIDAKEGDSVEIFGNNNPVWELADVMGTIPYEVLTSVSERVKRIYVSE